MRATFRQMERKPGSSPGPAGTRRQGRRRRRTPRLEQLERQAHASARRVLDGEVNVARGLGSNDPAAAAVPSSLGTTLPPAVLEDLEASFGADLSSVRIHHDAAASAAASAESAEAFTAGAHIFFAQGAYDPSTTAGLELLSHEVAHVLQQTGRVSAEGRLRATPASGSGEIQRADFPDFPELVRLHRPADAAAAYDFVVAKIRRLLEKSKDWRTDPIVRALLNEFAARSEKKLDAWPAEAESLLYDCLKAVGDLQAAVSLLERDDFKGGMRIRTALFELGIWDVIRDRHGLAAFTSHVTRHPLVRSFWDGFFRAIRTFLFQPIDQPVPAVLGRDESGKPMELAVRRDELVTAGLDPAVVSANEWTLGTLHTLVFFDAGRIRIAEDIRARAVRAQLVEGMPEISRKRALANEIRDWGRVLQGTRTAEAVPPEARTALAPLLREFGVQVQRIGAEAVAVWDEALGIRRSRQELYGNVAVPLEDLAREDPTSRFRLVKAIARPLTSLRGFLEGLAAELFEPGSDGNRPPDAGEYVERTAGLADRLRTFSREALEREVERRFARRELESASALAWFAMWVAEYASYLELPAGVVGAPPTVDTTTLDWRLAHWIRSALWLWRLGTPLGWTGLVERSDRVLTAAEQEESQLALVSEWEPDKVAAVEDLTEDFGDTPLRGLEPLSAADLALFFRTEYHARLTGALTTLMGAGRETPRPSAEEPGPTYTPVLSRALEAVSQLDRPVRWKVADFALAFKGEDRDFLTLLAGHEKTRRLVEEQNAHGRMELFPLAFMGRAFLWFVPGIDRLGAELRTIPQLNILVQLELERQSRDLSPEDLEPADWLAVLRSAAVRTGPGGPSADELETVAAEIDRTLRAKRNAVDAALTIQLRRAASHHRQVLAERLRAPLIEYGDDHIRHYDGPNRTLQEIHLFDFAISPPEDAPLQISALILEIAPELSAAFRTETRYDVITGYMGFMERAQEAAAASSPQLLELLPPEERSETWLRERSELLTPVLEQFRKTQSDVQLRFGFIANREQQVLFSLVYGFPIKKEKDPFYVDGVGYELVEVRRDFVYHPGYGTPPAPGGSGSGGYRDSLLLEADGTRKLARTPGEVLVRIKINGVDKAVTDRDTDLLDLLSHVVEWRAFQLNMANLAYLIEKYREAMMELAQLIPGVAPAVVAVQILEGAVKFLESGDYKGFKELARGEILNILDELIESLRDKVNPDNLWLLFLFGDPRLEGMLSHKGGKNAKAGASGARPAAGRTAKPGTAITKVIASFRRLGVALYKSFQGLHRRVQNPMQSFRAFSTTRPIVSFVFQWAAENLVELAGKVEDVLSLFAEGTDQPTAAVSVKLREQQEGLVDRVGGILRALEELRLPQRPLNIEPVVAWLVGRLMVFVGKSLGYKGKAVTLVLDKTGAINLFSQQIAQQLVREGLDPNVYWQQKVIPEIEDEFNTAREDLVGAINDVLRAGVFRGAFDRVIKPERMSVAVSETETFSDTDPPPETFTPALEESELQPFVAAGRTMNTDGIPQTSPGAGRPLDPAVRVRAEARLGHDLGHVRLHADAAAMTGALGAEGLTSGSHVYLRPGLSPTTDRGAAILHHELAHVLQQTGPRPLGGLHDPRPVGGRPARGLHLDPAKEAAADRVARGADGAVGAEHLGVSPEGELQPAYLDLSTVSKFLKAVTDIGELKAAQDVIEGVKTRPKLETDVAPVVARIVTTLRNLQNLNEKTLPMPKAFHKVKPDIVAHLSGIGAEIDHAAHVIADRNTEDKTVSGPGKNEKRTVRVFNPGPFARDLEGYLLSRGGIAMAIDLKIVPGEKGTGRRVDQAAPVERIRIYHIHLPSIGGSSPLWAKAIDATWKGETDERRRVVRNTLRPLLAAKGPVAGIWPLWGDEYKFSVLLKREVEEQIRLSIAGNLKAADLRPWREYVAPTAASPIGLRVATYGDPSQRGTERESHHTTQFLLLEYFSNRSGKKPFVKGLPYPGVKWKGTDVELFAPPSGTVMVLEPQVATKRAPDMPAISLAGTTHRRGKLHVTPVADDLEGPSQSQAVHGKFIEHLTNADLKEATRSNAPRKQARTYLTTSQAHDDIAGAMKATYRWMRGDMAKKLRDALPEVEFDYFMAVAQDNQAVAPKGSTEERDFKSALRTAAVDAYKHNDTVMRTLGWED